MLGCPQGRPCTMLTVEATDQKHVGMVRYWTHILNSFVLNFLNNSKLLCVSRAVPPRDQR